MFNIKRLALGRSSFMSVSCNSCSRIYRLAVLRETILCTVLNTPGGRRWYWFLAHCGLISLFFKKWANTETQRNEGSSVYKNAIYCKAPSSHAVKLCFIENLIIEMVSRPREDHSMYTVQSLCPHLLFVMSHQDGPRTERHKGQNLSF